MKDSLVRNAVLSVVILILPIVLAILSKKYIVLAGLGVFLACSWVCSFLANTKAKEDPKKDHADIIIRVVGIFSNIVYVAAIVYGVIALFTKA